MLSVHICYVYIPLSRVQRLKFFPAVYMYICTSICLFAVSVALIISFSRLLSALRTVYIPKHVTNLASMPGLPHLYHLFLPDMLHVVRKAQQN